MADEHPTIFALSSGSGRSGVAVIRVSGPRSRFAIETMCGVLPPPRLASLQSIRNRDGQLIDRGLVLWFPGPQSFTGEDSAEFQVHGSAAVVSDLLCALGEFDGCIPAEAGAFARRAFESGKLDLTAVEGLADLIDAETTAQRKAALRQAEGGLAALYEGWRRQLLQAMARVETGIDFSDEGDVSEGVIAEALPLIDSVQKEITAHLVSSGRARALREGLTLCVAGPPNAGKSTFVNWLAQRDVAIVDAEAGTTRDRLESRIVLASVPVTLIDTAGLRTDPATRIEGLGIERAREAAARADVGVWLMSADSIVGDSLPTKKIDSDAEWIRVWNKSDLAASPDSDSATQHTISLKTGAGLENLLTDLEERIGHHAGLTESPAATRERHVAILDNVRDALAEAKHVRALEQAELLAEILRRAADDLGELTGRIDVEEVLGSIFAEFCIGK